MYEDDPQEKVFDVLGEAVFGAHPLGRAIIGRADVIARDAGRRDRRLPRLPLQPGEHRDRRCRRRRPRPARRARARRRRRARSADACAPAPARYAPPNADRAAAASSARTPSSSMSASAAPGSPATTSAGSHCGVLDTIFGGTSSSRLFQEVREQRGLAYAVYSFTSAYQDGGQVGLYLGTRADNLAEALAVVGTELVHLLEEPATATGADARQGEPQGPGAAGLESTPARMNRLGSELLAGTPLLSLDEVVERIEAVSLDDLRALSEELWAPERLSFAGIGPDQDAVRRGDRGRPRGPDGMSAERSARRAAVIRVAVAGAAGRMGATICEAVIERARHGAGRPRGPGARRHAGAGAGSAPGRAGRLHGPHERGAERPAGRRGRRSRRDRNHRL